MTTQMENDTENLLNHLESLKYEIERLQKEIEEFKSENKMNKLFEEIDKVINDPEILIGSIIFIDGKTVKFISKTQEGKYNNIIIHGNKAYFYDYRIYEVKDKNVKISLLGEYDIPDNIINMIKTLPESQLESVNPTLIKLYYFLKQGYKLTVTQTKNY